MANDYNAGFDVNRWRITPQAIQEGIAASAAMMPNQQPQAQPYDAAQAVTDATLAGSAKDNAEYEAQINAAAQQPPIDLQQFMPQRQDADAISKLFADYSRPSEDVYNDTYNQLVMSGVYGDEAHRLASRTANQYRADRLANLQLGFQIGGVDPGGYINGNGLYLLQQMKDEDPETANMIANSYDPAKVGYARAWDIARGDYNAQRQYEYGQRGADAQMNRQIEMLGVRQQMQEAELARRAQYAIQAAGMQTYMDAINQGATPEQAKMLADAAGQIAYNQILSGYNGGGLGSGGRNGRGGNKASDNGIGYDTMAKRSKDLYERYYDEMGGGWKDKDAEKEYNRLQERIRNLMEGRQDSDSGNPQSVAVFAMNLSQQYGVSLPQALQAIKKRYPDADTNAAAQLLGVSQESSNETPLDVDAVIESIAPNAPEENKEETSEERYGDWAYDPSSEAVATVNETRDVSTPEDIAEENARNTRSNAIDSFVDSRYGKRGKNKKPITLRPQ